MHLHKHSVTNHSVLSCHTHMSLWKHLLVHICMHGCMPIYMRVAQLRYSDDTTSRGHHLMLMYFLYLLDHQILMSAPINKLLVSALMAVTLVHAILDTQEMGHNAVVSTLTSLVTVCCCYHGKPRVTGIDTSCTGYSMIVALSIIVTCIIFSS